MWYNPNNNITRTIGERIVYSNERSCVNCTHELICWSISNLSRPNLVWFTLRSSWNERNLEPYLKSIYGGICENFNNTNYNIRTLQNAEDLKVDEKNIEKEWEV